MFSHILCIDDDPITLMLSKKVVAKSSFSENVLTAHNGQDALRFFDQIKTGAIAEDQVPKLIFLDLNMPVMGGWEFLDHFTTQAYTEFNGIPVVILSSTINPEDLKKAAEYSIVTDFLSKPITSNMLEVLHKKFEI